ncbi:MAG: ABC transporter permease, partial [Anaerolineae bacterium]|nr:ABC transporter permease [Anaerolineae bacterium]
MAEASLSVEMGAEPEAKETRRTNTFLRLARYTAIRLVALFFTIVVAVYLAILIANMGGFVDNIRRAEIRERVGMMVLGDPNMTRLPEAERNRMVAEMIALQEKRLGLDQPFVIRSFVYLGDALTLNLGRAENMYSDSGSKEVRLILLERLPATLVMWGLANLLLFFLALFLALALSRRYGSWFDRAIIALTPTSSAPGWFYGLFLILIFAALLRVLPYGGMVDAPPPDNPVQYALSLAKHLVLPVTAILISSLFLSVYNWRTFFLIYSSEDYVEMAQAKGLSDREIERRYVLRPTLPTIITSFALTLITLWTGAIILETVFNWPGLGRAYYQAI